jgi:hypothetical protein
MMASHRGAKPVRHLSVAYQSANSKSMNLCHAAALALVDWYLMVPPISNGTPEIAGPLSRWEIQSSYDTAVECQSNLYLVVKQALADLEKPMVQDKKSLVLQFSSATCVASDDPHLEEK